jgi:hypothetical protein
VPFTESSLATEGLKKVNMSGKEEQCVVNVQVRGVGGVVSTSWGVLRGVPERGAV